MSHASLGPAFSDHECKRALERRGLSWRELTEDERYDAVARLIADGKVVGWFEGRMEIGPRALGNRSILADPRQADMKDILNERVKHREPFRPFAPAVLEESAAEYFDLDRQSPFMLFVHDIRQEKLSQIPAVAHVDGTARVQTVSKEHSPAFWKLIEAFGRITGVPIIVNTSFNVMGEPIVCSPDDAVSCFLGTDIDALVLNRLLVMRSGVPPG